MAWILALPPQVLYRYIEAAMFHGAHAHSQLIVLFMRPSTIRDLDNWRRILAHASCIRSWCVSANALSVCCCGGIGWCEIASKANRCCGKHTLRWRQTNTSAHTQICQKKVVTHLLQIKGTGKTAARCLLILLCEWLTRRTDLGGWKTQREIPSFLTCCSVLIVH
jgi:hypothetical protein